MPIKTNLGAIKNQLTKANQNLQWKEIIHKFHLQKIWIRIKVHKKFILQIIDHIWMASIILLEWKLMKMGNMLFQNFSNIPKYFRNVSSPNFGPLPGRISPNKRIAIEPLGPGSYEISNNSPGKYF